MRTEPDVTRAVRSWLEDGADRLPERVLDSVLDAVPSTPQRRPWWPPRRLFEMTSKLQITAVAVAIVAVVLVGWRLLPAPGGVGGPEPTLSPSSSPSASPASPSPSPSTIPIGIANVYAFQPGTYRVPDPFIAPLSITFASPWSSALLSAEAIAFYRSQPADFAPGLVVDRVHRVFDDPCHPPALTASPSASPGTPLTGDEVVAALQSMQGFEAGPVTDTTVGGHPARTFVLTNALTDEAAGQCTGSPLDLWQGGGGHNTTNQRATDHIWVVDVNGTPITIDAQSVPGQTPEEMVAEVEEVVASIQFDE